MTEKKLIYESPWMDFCEELLFNPICLTGSVEQDVVYDKDPYFDDVI